MKFWITKYALTQGIYEVEAEISSVVPEMISSTKSGNYHGKDWHKTKEEAIKRAEDMRTKKIESLKEQINKLENMKFN